jgi:hypothetical protein
LTQALGGTQSAPLASAHALGTISAGAVGDAAVSASGLVASASPGLAALDGSGSGSGAAGCGAAAEHAATQATQSAVAVCLATRKIEGSSAVRVATVRDLVMLACLPESAAEVNDVDAGCARDVTCAERPTP